MSAEIINLAILALIILIVCGAVWFLGQWLSRRVARSQSRLATVSVTRAGYVWVAVQTVLMVGAVVLFNLFPDNALSRWATASPGTAIVLFFIACAVLAGILGRRGTKLLEIKRRDA